MVMAEKGLEEVEEVDFDRFWGVTEK